MNHELLMTKVNTRMPEKKNDFKVSSWPNCEKSTGYWDLHLGKKQVKNDSVPHRHNIILFKNKC